MLLREQEFGALGFKATEKEVCAELEDVGGLCFQYFAIEGRDLIGVVGWERH
jgi:hypothetical protein